LCEQRIFTEILLMSLFNNILEKLGLRTSHATTQGTSNARPAPTATHGESAQQSSPGSTRSTAGGAGPATSVGPHSDAQRSRAETGNAAPQTSSGTATPTSWSGAVDVTRHLDELAAKNPGKLNWKTSIVDLLKLLDLDSSLAARKALADELGAPSALEDGSAEMNVWLHRTVLAKVAENGGHVPRELID
jgi:hypothetical protein